MTHTPFFWEVCSAWRQTPASPSFLFKDSQGRTLGSDLYTTPICAGRTAVLPLHSLCLHLLQKTWRSSSALWDWDTEPAFFPQICQWRFRCKHWNMFVQVITSQRSFQTHRNNVLQKIPYPIGFPSLKCDHRPATQINTRPSDLELTLIFLSPYEILEKIQHGVTFSTTTIKIIHGWMGI